MHIGNKASKARHWQTSWFVPNRVKGSGGVTLPGNVCKFYLYLSLETVFAARKPTQNSYINVNFLFLKIGNLIINWVPISLLPTYCAWKTIFTIEKKYDKKRTSKFKNSKKLSSELGEIWKCRLILTYIQKPNFHLYHELEKN